MPRLAVGIALAVLFLVVLAATAPAHLMARLLPTDSVRLSGFSGTIWEGEASSAIIAIDRNWVQLGQVRWSLSQLYLLILSPTADVESRWGQQRLRANVRLSPSGNIRLRSLESRFSAGLIKRWLPMNLRGDVSLQTNDFRISDGKAQSGRGRVVWQGASWRGSRGFRPLGDYVLEFAVTAPQQLEGRVSTLAGPVTIEGGLNVNGRSYAVDASLSSEQAFDPELASALELLAAPVDGGFQLKFESEF
jgi:hypothetical protein